MIYCELYDLSNREKRRSSRGNLASMPETPNIYDRKHDQVLREVVDAISHTTWTAYQ